MFTLFGTAISWKSVQQPVVALSTTEAEFMALTEAIKEALWLQGIIHEFDITQAEIKVFCDSQSAIHLVKHQMYHERTKHIDVKFHFIRDIVEKEIVKVCKISTLENPADAMTKSVPTAKFELCCALIKKCNGGVQV